MRTLRATRRCCCAWTGWGQLAEAGEGACGAAAVIPEGERRRSSRVAKQSVTFQMLSHEFCDAEERQAERTRTGRKRTAPVSYEEEQAREAAEREEKARCAAASASGTCGAAGASGGAAAGCASAAGAAGGGLADRRRECSPAGAAVCVSDPVQARSLPGMQRGLCGQHRQGDAAQARLSSDSTGRCVHVRILQSSVVG